MNTISDVCYNCTEIIVNGIRRYNNETVYINVGEDLMIEGDIPRVFKVLNFAAWVNNSNSKICTCDEMLISLKCNCSNLITNNSGVYRLHISLEIECTSSNPEWLSNNVIIIVQREQQSTYIYIYTHIYIHTYIHVRIYRIIIGNHPRKKIFANFADFWALANVFLLLFSINFV